MSIAKNSHLKFGARLPRNLISQRLATVANEKKEASNARSVHARTGMRTRGAREAERREARGGRAHNTTNHRIHNHNLITTNKKSKRFGPRP